MEIRLLVKKKKVVQVINYEVDPGPRKNDEARKRLSCEIKERSRYQRTLWSERSGLRGLKAKECWKNMRWSDSGVLERVLVCLG